MSQHEGMGAPRLSPYFNHETDIASEERLATPGDADAQMKSLLDLPYELIVRVLLELPPDPSHLLKVSQVCKGLHTASQEAVLWSRLLYNVAGPSLSPEVSGRIQATNAPPLGTWEGNLWRVGSHSRFAQSFRRESFQWPAWLSYINQRLWPSSSPQLPAVTPEDLGVPSSTCSTKLLPTLEDYDVTARIPVHYPTLYRSRLHIQDELTGRVHTHNETLDQDQNSSDSETDSNTRAARAVVPYRLWCSGEHTAKVYAIKNHGQWAISGSRDKSVKVWRHPFLPLDGSHPHGGPQVMCTVSDAHSGSVLSLDFEVEDAYLEQQHSLDKRASTGFLVTGSSDATAKAWSINWGRHGEHGRDAVEVTPLSTLSFQTERVSAVAFNTEFVATGCNDGTIRLYDRSSVYEHESASPVHTLSPHSSAISGLVMHADPSAQVVAASSSDGRWTLIDMRAGTVILRGGEGANEIEGFGCLDWKGDTLICGGSSGSLHVFSSIDGGLIRTFERPNNANNRRVRAIQLDLNEDGNGNSNGATIVSGGFDSEIHIWDSAQGRLIRTYGLGLGPVFALSKDGVRLAGAAANKVFFVTYGVGQPYLGLFG